MQVLMKRFSPLSSFFTFSFCITCLAVSVFAQTVDPYQETREKDAAVQKYQVLQQRPNLTPDAEPALDADVIINLLTKNPALALEIKRELIQKAFDQGRLLEQEDLTDAVLYDLIRQQLSIRQIATEQIESRHYLELKPTDQEIFEARLNRREVERLESAEERRQDKKDREEEEENGTAPPRAIVRTANGTPPDPSKTVIVPKVDPSSNGRALDERDLPRVSPSELPQLLQASGDGRGGAMAVRAGSSVPTLGAAGYGASGLGAAGLGASSLYPGITPEPTSVSDAAVLSGQNEMASLDRPRYLIPRKPEATERRAFHRKPNPYANVPSLYDLYEQAPAQGKQLERFGSEIFENGTGNFDELPMDVPVGPDYVVGPGDGLSVDMWGSVSQRLQRVVDREGRVSLPEVGTVLVSGKTLAQVQQTLQSSLRSEFRDIQTDVSLARLRTVRVYVVGDVQNPGAYDVSSLSTPLNALYEAGGPTAGGSLRVLQHYRGKQLVEQVDLYDLLLHGVNADLQRLEPGDTIKIPPARPEIAVEGMVRRPAKYELLQEKTLDEVLELAGGVLPSGALRHIEVERVQAHQDRVMLSLDLPDNDTPDQVTQALANFKVQDGDRIRIAPILPYAQKSVYLDGHVFRPGKYGYHDGMKISDLIHSYSDMLPEPSERHAEVIRLSAPDFRPTILSFNIGEAMKGDPKADLLLQPLDTVRIFGRYDFEDPPEVTVSGEVRKPGTHRSSGEMHVRDAVYAAGGLTADAMLSDAQIFRRENGQVSVMSVNLASALKGDPAANLLLRPRDRLIVHRDLAKADPASVMIEGEVGKPGKYPLADGMTAGELVRLAGGFKRGAYTELADLSRYSLQDGAKIQGEHQQIEIAKALSSPDADVPLRDGDTLTIRQIAGFKDIGSTVTVRGEVMHPSVYGIEEGEKLSSVLRRAGGFSPDAYAQGIVLSRVSLREMEEQNRSELLRRLAQETAAQKYKPGTNPADVAVQQQSLELQQDQIISRIKNEPPIGRLVVRISGDISKWQNTAADVELRKGDTILIPKRPTQVLVTGQVYNPTAIGYVPGKNAEWYLRQAGGINELANKKSVFIVRADGSIFGHASGATEGFWHESVLKTTLRPGDTIVVPERLLGGSQTFKTLLESAQIVSSIAISAKAVGVF